MQEISLRNPAAVLLAGQVVGAGMAFLAEIPLARNLGPGKRGDLALVFTTIQFAAVAGAFALGQVIVRSLRSRLLSDAAAATIILRTTPLVATFVALPTLTVLLLIFPQLRHTPLAIFTLIALIMAPGLTNVRQLMNGMQRSPAASLNLVVERATFCIVIFLLASTHDISTNSAVMGLALATSVAMALAARNVLSGRPQAPAPFVFPRPELRAGLRILPNNLIQFVSYRLDIFLVAALSGSAETGAYALAVSLASVLWYVGDSLGMAAYPQACDDLARRLRPTAALRTARTAGIATLLLAITGGVFAPSVIPIMFGSEFERSVPPFLLLLPGVVAFSVTKVLGGVLIAAHAERFGTRATIVGGALTVGLDLLLIPSLGASGAALASTIAYSATTGLVVLLVRRRLREELDDAA